MNNLKLKNKILLILALPIIAVLVLSSISIFENIEKENKMSKTTEYINFTVKVSEFLTQFQNERELGILYLDSYGKNKKSELTSQINRSEERFNQLKSHKNSGFEMVMTSYSGKQITRTQQLNSYYNEVVSLKNKILGYFNNDDNKPKYRTKF